MIGLSVFVLLGMAIIDMAVGTNNAEHEDLVAAHLRTLQQTIEKTAIFVDITRLSVLVSKLKNDG